MPTPFVIISFCETWRGVPACSLVQREGWLLRVRVLMAGKVWRKEKRLSEDERRRDERHVARENVNWGDLLRN